MNIVHERITVEPLSGSVSPGLKIKIPFECGDLETPTSVAGVLRSLDGIIIAPAILFTDEGYSPTFTTKQKTGASYFWKLVVFLSAKSVEFIENKRMGNPNKDVVLGLSIEYSYLNLANRQVTGGYVQEIQSAQFTNGGCRLEIPASRWINEFATPLGIGKFLIYELRLPDITIKGNSEWDKYIEKGFLNLEKILEQIKLGDWDTAIEKGRKFYEVFKFDEKKRVFDKVMKEKLKTLFLDANYSDKSFENFCGNLLNSFDFSCKFIHEKDNQGQFLETPQARKEDAYFVYTNCFSLLNMISSKCK